MRSLWSSSPARSNSSIQRGASAFVAWPAVAEPSWLRRIELALAAFGLTAVEFSLRDAHARLRIRIEPHAPEQVGAR